MDEYGEQVILEIISNAGEAKSYSFKALQEAKTGDFDKADKTLDMAKKSLEKVHNIQTELIRKEINGQDVNVSLLMAHAQDHLMMAMLSQELITEMVEQYRVINLLSGKQK